MQIIEPIIEVEKFDGKQIMKKIERACRNCYRSEGLITEDSYEKLIRNCIVRGHGSPFEHEKITVRFTSDVGCYDEKTQVLTTTGWKYFKDVTPTDKVFTMTDDGEVIETGIRAKVEKYYFGEMYHFKSTQIDLLVTPDHNMWVYDEHKRSKRTKIWKFLQAQDMTNSCYKFSKRGNKHLNNGISLTKVPDYVSSTNLVHAGIDILNTESFFELLGWLITDGCLEVRGNYKRVRFSQTKKEGLNRVAYLLDSLCLNYESNKGGISIKSQALAHFFHQFFYKPGLTSKSLTMFVPQFIKNAFSNEINAFLKGVIGGNGYIKKNGTTTVITSASEEFCKDIVDLCFRVGKTANYYIHPNLNKYHTSFKQNHTVYDISIHSIETHYWCKNDKNFEVLEFAGNVYCLMLDEHHKLFVMRNGKTCWCGNCYKDLTRHRAGTAFSIESTRYCNYSKDKFGNEIKFIKPVNIKEGTPEYERWKETMQVIEDNYMQMVDLGCKPDQLRMILPHSTAAQVVMTANIREWRHILSLRCSKMAHPSIRQILIPLLLKFKQEMPCLFEDIEYDTEFDVNDYAKIKDMEEV